MEVVGVEQLEAEEGKNDLKRERATIHKVTIEQLNSAVKTDDICSGFETFDGLDTEWHKQAG